MSEHLYLLTLSLFLGTVVLIFGMKYVSAAVQGWSRIKSETAYRELAAKAVTAQSANAASHSASSVARVCEAMTCAGVASNASTGTILIPRSVT